MEYRFPKWHSYVFLGLLVLVFAAGVYAVVAPTARFGIGAAIVFSVVGACLVTLLARVYIYVRCFSIEIGAEGVTIANLFRVRTIPYATIKQVVRVTASRGGTDAWLLDGNNAVVAKVDGGLAGFDGLLISLGKALQPYKALFYRRESFGPWEMQVAGDSHWAPYEAPNFAQSSERRLRYAMSVGCVLIAIAVALSWFAGHGILLSR
jgi:hypothetical protein